MCKAFVDGLLGGLKFVYLNPEKAIGIHIDSLKEFQGGAPATREVLLYGQEVGTSVGFVNSFKQHGLGHIDTCRHHQAICHHLHGDQACSPRPTSSGLDAALVLMLPADKAFILNP